MASATTSGCLIGSAHSGDDVRRCSGSRPSRLTMNLDIDRRTGLRFIGVFLAAFAALQFGMIASEGTALERLLLDRATVSVAAHVADWVFPLDGVHAESYTIASSRVRLNVLRGCEGTDAMFLIVAASLAFRASARSRLLALTVGLAMTYVLNQLRILALYYTIRDARDRFELVHAYVAPTCLVVCIALFFWWWTRRARIEL